MSTTAKASIHIKPCKIVQSEQHNRRDMDYINSLDPAKLYIRTDLMHLNESYVAPGMEGVSLQQLYDSIKAMVKKKTGRAMQEKDVEFTDKKGKKRVRQGCSPIRESVVNIKPDTTMDDLLRYAERVQERWGIRAIQIHMHLDEGHYENVQDPATWKPNLHAHIIWDWMNHDTGKSYKLNADDMSEMQDMVAETLAMERGRKKAETGLDHLERNDYILQKQKEKERQLREEAEKALAKKKAAETQAAAAEVEKVKAEQQAAAANAEKAAAEQEAMTAKEILAKMQETTKSQKEKMQLLSKRISDMQLEQTALATENRSQQKEKTRLDKAIKTKQQRSDALDDNIEAKENRVSELDGFILSKTEQVGTLQTTIQEKSHQVKELDSQLEAKERELSNLTDQEPWYQNMFTSLAVLLYKGDEGLRFCISAIQDYAYSGTGCRGGKHGDILWDEESSAIKSFMEYFNKLTQMPFEQTGKFLVWFADQLSHFNNLEMRRASREVKDVALGRYDGRIRRVQNRGGGRGR